MKGCATAMPASFGLPLFDLTSNRHGGNAESAAAYERAAESGAVTRDRERVLAAVKLAGNVGTTCKELAGAWGVDMNAVSGRFTELCSTHWIKRKTDADGRVVRRDGCAVWVANG